MASLHEKVSMGELRPNIFCRFNPSDSSRYSFNELGAALLAFIENKPISGIREIAFERLDAIDGKYSENCLWLDAMYSSWPSLVRSRELYILILETHWVFATSVLAWKNCAEVRNQVSLS